MHGAGRNPKYRQAADAIAARIRNGDYLPGAVLPGEVTLGRELDISTPTVRLALEVLFSLGLAHRSAEDGRSVVGAAGTARLPSPPAKYIVAAEVIAAAIVDGTFTPGKRLPSTPGLEAMCGVSRVTLHSAFALLHSAGWIVVFRACRVVAAREDWPDQERWRQILDAGTPPEPVDQAGRTEQAVTRSFRDLVDEQLGALVAGLAPGAKIPDIGDLMAFLDVGYVVARDARMALERRGLIHRTTSAFYAGPGRAHVREDSPAIAGGIGEAGRTESDASPWWARIEDQVPELLAAMIKVPPYDKPGVELPAAKQLSEELTASVKAVQKARARLAGDGLIHRVGSRFFTGPGVATVPNLARTIASALEVRIRAGRLPEGAAIVRDEVAREFDAKLATVHKAMDLLREKRLIVTRAGRGGGTVVAAAALRNSDPDRRKSEQR